MPGVPVTRTDAIHKGILSTDVAEEVEDLLFWQGFIAKILRGKKGELTAPISPIAQMDEFSNLQQGGDNMLIPQVRDLTGAAFFGDNAISGLGEKQTWYYLRVYVNQLRFPVEGPTRMGDLRAKNLDLITRLRSQLSKRMAKEQDVNIASAFYEGYSRNITASAANSGLARTKRHHPNFYTANGGLATWSGTVATHADNIGAKLDALNTGDVNSHLTIDLLRKMRSVCLDLPIDPITVQGQEFWPMLVHHHAMAQLRADPLWRSSYENAFFRGIQNHVFGTAVAYAENFLLFERKFSVFGISTSLSGSTYTLTFGATNPASATDTNENKGNIIFGNGAIGRGMAEAIFFGEEIKDHANYKEVSIGSIVGEARSDAFDEDPDSGTPTAVDNKSSLIVVTASPDPFT